MASSASPLDREAQSARETIVSAYASTLAASPETYGRIEASPDLPSSQLGLRLNDSAQACQATALHVQAAGKEIRHELWNEMRL